MLAALVLVSVVARFRHYRLWEILMLLGLAGARVSRAEAAASSDALVWCGLDYSMVKMIGAGDFREPDRIFPGILAEWNALFMKER